MSKPFSIKYDWKDFNNTSSLTSFQKYRIKNRFTKEVKQSIQKVINQSVEDRDKRREDLDAHQDPKHPFRLDLGGEG
jgi:hypothetical protein